jgi:hypothetical protein
MSRDPAKPPTRAVCEVAARLPAAVKSDDAARIAELMSKIPTVSDLTALVLLLAQCADRHRLTVETGLLADATLKELHSAYTSYRYRGVPHPEIPAYIRSGENAYQHHVRAARGQIKRQPRPEQETSSAA